MNVWGEEEGEQFIPRTARATLQHAAYEYGTSLDGTPLHAYLPFTWGATRTLVIAGIHGEEPDASNVLSYVLRSVSPAYLRKAVILCANPDGMTHGTRGNARGVDLNRNFPAQNWQSKAVATRWELSLPRDVVLSPGNAPGSEPETRSLLQLIKDREIEQIVAVHSPLGCINYEHDREWALVTMLANNLELPIISDIGYPCPGSMDSWAKEKGIPLLTIELEEHLSLGAIRQKYGPVLQDLIT